MVITELLLHYKVQQWEFGGARMQTLVAIKDGYIITTIDNWDLPDRKHLRKQEKANIRAKYGDVVFKTVRDSSIEKRMARNLQPGWLWDHGVGTKPARLLKIPGEKVCYDGHKQVKQHLIGLASYYSDGPKLSKKQVQQHLNGLDSLLKRLKGKEKVAVATFIKNFRALLRDTNLYDTKLWLKVKTQKAAMTGGL